MATAAEPLSGLPQAEASQDLARSWKKLTRAATIVAVLTSPALYIWFTQQSDMVWWKAILATVAIVVVFRGFVFVEPRIWLRAWHDAGDIGIDSRFSRA